MSNGDGANPGERRAGRVASVKNETEKPAPPRVRDPCREAPVPRRRRAAGGVRGLRAGPTQPGCVAVEAAPRGFPDPAGGRGRRPQCTREKI